MPTPVQALARSTHPGPTAAVTTIAVVLGAGVGVQPAYLVLLGLAVLANQFSVGLSNDWIDAERDRIVGRMDKPIARGWISVETIRTAACASALASILLTIPLGLGAVIANALFIASGWSYNAGLKNSVLSVVPYIVGFGSLPLLVTLSLAQPMLAQWWAIAAGSALGIAAHFANVLPDLEDDRRTGIAGLPHRLGRRGAGVATYAVLAAASAVIAFGSNAAMGAATWIGLALTLGIAIAGVVLVLTRPPTRLLFQLIIGAALLNVVMLAIAGKALIA